jgi:hypothetical protein
MITEMPPWEYLKMIASAANASGIAVEDAMRFVTEMAHRMHERDGEGSSMVQEPEQVM